MSKLASAITALNQLQANLEVAQRKCRQTGVEGLFQDDAARLACENYFSRALGLIEVIRTTRLPRAVSDPAEFDEIANLVEAMRDSAQSVLTDVDAANSLAVVIDSTAESFRDANELARRAGSVVEDAAGGFGVALAVILVVAILVKLK